MEEFIDLGLSEDMLATLARKGFSAPTPVQQAIIPFLLKDKRDVVARSATGTGKTAAFGIPIIERLDASDRRVKALVLTPTRELALQVTNELASLTGKRRLSTLAVYGGQPFPPQLKALKQGVDIVVGTPGRILDHIRRGSLDLKGLTYLVIDEADEMLDMGFIEDIETIIAETPKNRRTLLFSATMPKAVLSIARHYMADYEYLAMATSIKTQELTEQIYYEVREQDKFEALCRIIDLAPDFYGLVFCRTRAETADIAERLSSRGYKADGIHGELGQDQREQIMRRFRNKAITILVATDVAARGIDVNHLSHVVNFDLPQDGNAYTHRIGRTGRAGRKGIAVSLVEPHELRMIDHIRRACGAHLRKGRIPGVAELIAAKHERLKATITQVSQGQDCTAYHLLARELLGTGEAVNVLAACLRHAFGGELDQGAYAEIVSPANAGAVLPLTRLRVARGRKHGFNPRTLVRLIRERTGVKERLVRDIEVLNDCTFISVPRAEAAVIQKRLRDKDGQPLSSGTGPKKAAAQGRDAAANGKPLAGVRFHGQNAAWK